MENWVWRRVGARIPHVKDVGAPSHDEAPFDGRLEAVWFVGSDGSLWAFSQTMWEASQVPSPGNLSRAAGSPDRSVWCVDTLGKLWKMQGGTWIQVDVPGEYVVDVSVSADRTVWLVMKNGRYYSIAGNGTPYYHGVVLSLDAIAGVSAANNDHPYGIAWGVSPMYGPSTLCMCAAANGWRPTNINNVKDISTAQGLVWMVKEDGTIWNTTDGQAGLRSDTTGGFLRISAGVTNQFAVSVDGSAWIRLLEPKPTKPSAIEPPPKPITPPPSALPTPAIAVATDGNGTSTVFTVTGSSFVANAQVTIRGARIADGAILQSYWLTTADKDGKILLPIPLPCVPGIGISFSATDGRPNAADMTHKLWSNTVTARCP